MAGPRFQTHFWRRSKTCPRRRSWARAGLVADRRRWLRPAGLAAAAPGRGGAAAGGPGGGGTPSVTFTDDWQILHPGKKLIGRAVTMQMMPYRAEVASVDSAEARSKGIGLGGQAGLDILQPGDVLVIDCGGSQLAGLYGDNLVYYLWKKTGTGLVIDGYIRDLEGIATFDVPLYYRGAVPDYQTGTMLTGLNVPIRIGKATVMPGDVVFGDREGVNFIPPQAVQRIVDGAKTTRIHDEWTRKKFDEGKYKSSDIYSSPRDPALRQEYQEYLKQQLEKQK